MGYEDAIPRSKVEGPAPQTPQEYLTRLLQRQIRFNVDMVRNFQRLALTKQVDKEELELAFDNLDEMLREFDEYTALIGGDGVD